MADNVGTAELQLERLAFEEIQYSRVIEMTDGKTEYEMNFNREIIADSSNERFKVSLTANIWSKGEPSVQMRIRMAGYFRCICDDEGLKQELIRYNTVAIMFPYIRSQISLVTTQPDIPPISFPPVNIIAMFKDVDNREEQSN